MYGGKKRRRQMSWADGWRVTDSAARVRDKNEFQISALSPSSSHRVIGAAPAKCGGSISKATRGGGGSHGGRIISTAQIMA